MKVQVDIDRAYFRTADGRVMFEASVGTDGRSIEIRGVECCRVDGVLYRESLVVQPRCSNVIVVHTLPYDQV